MRCGYVPVDVDCVIVRCVCANRGPRTVVESVSMYMRKRSGGMVVVFQMDVEEGSLHEPPEEGRNAQDCTGDAHKFSSTLYHQASGFALQHGTAWLLGRKRGVLPLWNHIGGGEPKQQFSAGFFIEEPMDKEIGSVDDIHHQSLHFRIVETRQLHEHLLALGYCAAERRVLPLWACA